ncbi:MAG: hypothetical protein ACRDHM_08135 [Actinomycetota bacterium]
MRARSALVVICLVGLSLVAAAAPAGATFHMMKVREVHAGTAIEASADFVELQMYQVGQNQVSTHKLKLYDAAGAFRECTIPSNVASANNQETILFGTTQAQSAFGPADFTIPAFLEHGAGAVCFENIDCVSWGSFPGGAADQDGGAGTPFAGGIPIGQSIDRKLGANNTLEATDDTNNSANDFEAEAPSANPNGPVNPLSSPTATCTPATGGGGDTLEPTSRINAPKHKAEVKVSEARNLQGTASDQGGSGVAKVQLALRQKRQGGCKWWNGSAFVSGGCTAKVYFDANGEQTWSYKVSKKLQPTGGKIKNYTLYSHATDGAGLVESDFLPGRNLSKFEVTSRRFGGEDLGEE